MTRHTRTLAAIALPAVVALALAACSGTSAPGASEGSSTTLTFATFGGAYEQAQKDAWLDEFTKETGIAVVTDAYDFGKLETMVEAGDTYWDVVDTDMGLESSSNLFEKLDCTVITTCGQPVEGLIDTDWRIAQSTTSMVLAYNSDKVAEPSGWVDFFDTKNFPGKRGFPSWISGGAIEAALLADGVAPEDLYPLDVDRALKKLDTIKGDIIWWETATQSEDLLSSGETAMSVVFSPRAYNLSVVGGQPVSAQWNQVLTHGNYLAIPKGTKNLDAAQKLVAFIASKEHNAKLGELYPVGPGTAGSTANVPAAIAAWLPTNHLDTAVAVSDVYWDANFSDVNEKFQSWLQQ